jgi:tetratricopeptide (TPR) repeat protein
MEPEASETVNGDIAKNKSTRTVNILVLIGILLAVVAVGTRANWLWGIAGRSVINLVYLKAAMQHALEKDFAGMSKPMPPVSDPMTGLQARAMAYLAQAEGQTARGEKWLAEGLTDSPSAALTQFEMCLLYWNAGRRDLALQACRGTKYSALYWLNQGHIASEAGNIDDALAYYQMAGYTDPGLTVAWQQLGRGLYDKGYYDQAVLALERVLAHDPRPAADVFDALASAYLKLENAAMARDVLTKGLVIHSDQRVFYLGMADSYRLEGNYGAADGWYARLLQRWPYDAHTWADRGDLAMAMGRQKEAMTYYQEAISNEPDGAGYWLGLANAARENDDIVEATAAYEKVLDMRPNDTGIWLQAGRFLVDSDQIDEARRVFERILVLQPENVEAATQLAALVKKP